jgi:Fungal N-terminal domain of STAND proteins
MLYRGHVAQDVLPYMCIYEHCETPDKMYLTSDELLTHMRSQHSVTRWVCDHCSLKSEGVQSFVFENLGEWETHMHKKHSNSFPYAQLSSLAKVSQRRMLESISCPLCPYTGVSQSTLDDHIAQHLHGFALRCLPWGTDRGERYSVKAKSADASSSNDLHDEDIEDGELKYLNVTEASKPTELVRTFRDISLDIRYRYNTHLITIWPTKAEELWLRLQVAETKLSDRFFGPEPPPDHLSETLGSHMLKLIQILYQVLLGWEFVDGKREIALITEEMLENELDALDTALTTNQLSLAVRVFSVIELSAEVGSVCVQYSHEVKHAAEDVDRLQSEVKSLQSVLQNVKQLLDDSNCAKLSTSPMLSKEIDGCKSELTTLDQRLKAGKSRKTMSRVGFQALKWPFESKAVYEIIGRLERHKKSISLALEVDQM